MENALRHSRGNLIAGHFYVIMELNSRFAYEIYAE